MNKKINFLIVYLIFSLIIQFTTPSRSSGVVAAASAPSSPSLGCLSRLAGRRPTSAGHCPCSFARWIAVALGSYPASGRLAAVVVAVAADRPSDPCSPACRRSVDLGSDPDSADPTAVFWAKAKL